MKTDVPLSEVSRLFTMTFVVDRSLTMTKISEALTHRCTKAVNGCRFSDVFHLHRPHGVRCFDEMKNNLDTLYLLIATDKKFALRGQMVLLDNGETVMFLGSPWLPWVSENNPEVKFKLSEFPRHDPQMDAAFYEATQRSMLKDLEIVNDELRAAKEQSDKVYQVQADFFAVMNHEMRTPLNGIITSLSLSKDTISQKERDHLLKVADTSAEHLMSVINYVLDFSKLEAGELHVEDEEFNLHDTIHSIRDILLAKALASNISLEIELGSDVPMWVKGDGSKIRQVLLNLVGNAVKFCKTGSVITRIAVVHSMGARIGICFKVIDTGIGIPTEDQAKIFDAFWSSRDRAPSGDPNTGLGLNISQRLVALLGGVLAFKSEYGGGTTFDFTLELDSIDRSAFYDDAVDLSQQFEGHVLLVDDNQSNLFVGRILLERMGLCVRTAADGAEAVELASEREFDLVFMDIAMPVMNGEIATRTLRERGIEVPVIALTAHVGKKWQDEYIQAGMQGSVYKPINKSKLLRILSQHLESKTSKTQLEVEMEKSTLDWNVVENLIRDIGQSNFSEARAIFKVELEVKVNMLKIAWDQRDFARIALESHALKSSSASFGAVDLSVQMSKIEAAALSRKESILVDLVLTLDCLVAEAGIAFTTFDENSDRN
ncbi:MAG: signal transduction histidine kinase/DNA-binding response OmpR family regulator [Candidatus Azotimanducaceae bacterium]|jgi:signal transduction histidine kinase/DNA-binding response OmpR family regulator